MEAFSSSNLSCDICFFLRWYTKRTAPRRAPMTTKIPKTRPALAPIDILLLAAASDEVGLALERARDAVAEAKPAIAPVPVGTGEEVATMIVDAKCFGDVLAVAVSSGFSFLDVAVAFFDLGFEVALDADEIC
jgi:hypothetical protein